jgi:hypothetical protein
MVKLNRRSNGAGLAKPAGRRVRDVPEAIQFRCDREKFLSDFGFYTAAGIWKSGEESGFKSEYGVYSRLAVQASFALQAKISKSRIRSAFPCPSAHFSPTAASASRPTAFGPA